MAAEDRIYWTELEVMVPETAADVVSDFLFGVTGRGVCMREEDGLVRIQGFVSPESPEDTILSVRTYLDSLADLGELPADYHLAFRYLPENDWLDVFRAQHTTVRVSDRLVVRPSWCDPGPGREVVLDPGMAFGTGSHATTLMCLKLLDAVVGDPPPARMFDLGTGSGILAIAAAFLGVREVLAVDIDPESIATAVENARQNGVDTVIRFEEGSLERAAGPYDLVTANLSPSLLKRMAPRLTGIVAPGGRLILSGVLAVEEEEIGAAFTAGGLTLERCLVEDIWLAALFVKQKQGG